MTKASALAQDLSKSLKGTVRSCVPMHEYTSWRIGGPAELMVEPAGIDELALVLRLSREREVPVTVIGGGTNLLVADRGISGLTVRIGPAMSDIIVEGTRIMAGAGAPLPRVAQRAAQAALEGMACFAGIPGTVGGALSMNAGAYGHTVAELVLSASVVDAAGEILLLPADKLDFGYRTSSIKNKGLVAGEVTLSCRPGNRDEILRQMEEYREARQKAQPLQFPNAGSVFKNPPGLYAGQLIEKAGGKGVRRGGAMVSEKHANFIINTGGATAKDVLDLISSIRELVFNHFGLELELEVELAGDWQG